MMTLYSRAKKGGTAFGTFALCPMTDPLLRGKTISYEMYRFSWIGSLNSDVQTRHVHANGPIPPSPARRRQPF